MYGLLISLGVALFVSPLASSLPDGLDKTAQMLGFAGKAAEHPLVKPLAPEYQMPGLGSGALAVSAAGAVGVVVVFVLAAVLARVLVPNPQAPNQTDSPIVDQ